MDDEYCFDCQDMKDTSTHFERCEKDREGIADAAKWIKGMELEDVAINTYIAMENDGIKLPPVHIYVENYKKMYS